MPTKINELQIPIKEEVIEPEVKQSETIAPDPPPPPPPFSPEPGQDKDMDTEKQNPFSATTDDFDAMPDMEATMIGLEDQIPILTSLLIREIYIPKVNELAEKAGYDMDLLEKLAQQNRIPREMLPVLRRKSREKIEKLYVRESMIEKLEESINKIFEGKQIKITNPIVATVFIAITIPVSVYFTASMQSSRNYDEIQQLVAEFDKRNATPNANTTQNG